MNRKDVIDNFVYAPMFDELNRMKDIVWIELGVRKGGNAEFVLKTFNIAKIYLIDPYVPLDYLPELFGTADLVLENKKEAHAKLKAFSNKLVWLEDFSSKVVDEIEDESVDVLYVDGDHHFEAVFQDLKLYVPKVKKGGFVIGDDYSTDSVKAAIEHYSTESNLLYNVYRVQKQNKKQKFWFRK